MSEKYGTEKVLEEIHHERKRQVVIEGFGREHDDQHGAGDLAMAASCYAKFSANSDYQKPEKHYWIPPLGWPWAAEWWNPKNPRRDLIRAAALIVAEIERIDRASPATREG